MVLVLAHRGANRVARENTVDAFLAAADLGADGVEFDVRSTGDGALVIHHDPTIADVGVVGDLPSAALPSWVPSLEDALDACAAMTLVNVEIKFESGGDAATLAGAVAVTLAGRSARGAHVLVSSFSLDVIDAHRSAEPSIDTGWLTTLPPTRDILDVVVARGHRAIHPHELLIDQAAVDAAHDRELLVVAWTVDDLERAATLAGLGVDILITNVPDRVRAAIQ